jgi:hypothetical protein
MSLCPDCGSSVYERGKSPRTCTVAPCGQHLIGHRSEIPNVCRRKSHMMAVRNTVTYSIADPISLKAAKGQRKWREAAR